MNEISNETYQDEQITNPYMGPRSFTIEKKNCFFGREREARSLYSLLMARRLVLFYAQSGAGKTSLLNAGLIPKLKKDRKYEVLPVGRVGGGVRNESDAFAANWKNPFVYNLLSSLTLHTQLSQLPEEKRSLNDFLLHVAFDEETETFSYVDSVGQSASAGEGATAVTTSEQENDAAIIKPRVLIIDQFEELFTQHIHLENERRAFFEQVAEAMEADPYLYVLFSMREDYVARVTPYVHLLRDSLRSRFYLQQLQKEAALEAILKPAALAQREFEPDVAEMIVNCLGRSQEDPAYAEHETHLIIEAMQLQVVCYELWQLLKNQEVDQEEDSKTVPPISMEDVAWAAAQQRENARELEGEAAIELFVKNALGNFYETAVQKLLDHFHEKNYNHVDEFILRSWFSNDLITDSGTRDLLARGEESTKGLPETAVQLLDSLHLIRNEVRGANKFIELVHDSFVEPIRNANQQWERERAERIPWLNAALLYAKTGDASLLLKNSNSLNDAFSQASDVQQKSGLPKEAHDFLEASKVAQKDTSRKRRSQIFAFFSAVAILGLIFALVSWRSVKSANTQLTEANEDMAQLNDELTGANLEKTRLVDEKDEILEQLYIAKEEAEQGRLLVESRRLSDQAQDYLETANTTGALLLGVEIFKIVEEVQEAASDMVDTSTIVQELSSMQNLTQGLLLTSLYNSYESNVLGEVEGNHIFRESYRAPIQNIDNIFPGPRPNTIATFQDNAIIYWPIFTEPDSSIIITEILSVEELSPVLVTISPDHERLAVANDEGGIEVYTISENRIGQVPLLRLSLGAQERISTSSVETLVFDLDGERLAGIICEEIIQEDTNQISEQVEENKESDEQTGVANYGGEEAEQIKFCRLLIWSLQEDTQSPISCELTSLNFEGLAFLDNEQHIVLIEEDVESQIQRLVIENYTEEDCAPQRRALPENHNVNSLAILPGFNEQNGFLLTTGQMSQWWQLENKPDQISQISELGSTLATSNNVVAAMSLVDNNAFVLIDQVGQISVYDARTSKWPEFACALAGRTLTFSEWQAAFPGQEVEAYKPVCEEDYDIEYELHTSFVLTRLAEAEEMLLTLCQLESARVSFDKTIELTVDNPGLLIESNFDVWAIDQLMQQYVSGETSCQVPIMLAMVFDNLGDDVTWYDLISVAEFIKSGNELLSRGESDEGLAKLSEAQKLIDELPIYGELLQKQLGQGFINVCVNQLVEDTEQACSQAINYANTLSLGSLVTDETENTQLWLFEIDEAQVVSIAMDRLDDSLYPYLTLLDGNGNLLSTNDDGWEGVNALLTWPLAAGTYFVQASGLGDSTGSYTLGISTGDAEVVAGDGEPVVSNTAEQSFYIFEARAAQIITLDLESSSPEFDPYLTLIDSQGVAVATDDDSGDGFNSYDARIENFFLTEDGTYFIKAGRPNSTVPYTLTLRIIEPQVIEEGFVVDTTASQPVWQFEADAGQIVTIDLESSSPEFDPVLVLSDQNGDVITADDDSGEGFNGYDARIEGFALTESGTYFIETGRPNSTIPYTLTLQVEEPQLISLPAQLELVSGYSWSFDGEEDQMIKLFVTGAEFDLEFVELILLAPDNTILFKEAANSLLVLPQTGSYTVMAAGQTAVSDTTFLQIEEVSGELHPFAEGVGSGQLSGQTPAFWTFTNDVGDGVEITPAEGAEDVIMTLYAPTGQLLRTFDGRTAPENPVLKSNLTTPGNYILEVRGISDDSRGEYQLLLTALETINLPQNCSLDASADYGPITLGSRVILGEHTSVNGNTNWNEAMREYLGKEATVIELLGSDGSGCPIVHVDIDNSQWVWRIRDMIYSGEVVEGYAELAEAQASIEEAVFAVEDGRVAEGLHLLEEAFNLAPNVTVSTRTYNQICWFGSLYGFAADVLFACERAVEIEPDNGGIADSYGVALVLTGDYETAIDMFRLYIEQGGWNSDLRASWIVELEAGRNPLDEETLALLLTE